MLSSDSTKTSILIVDTDAELRASLTHYFTVQDFNVLAAADARQMDAILSGSAIDLIILDVLLPGESGLSVCRRLQERDAPAIILASSLTEEADRIVGLEFGADDYVCKPFSARELLARVRAVLRRRPAKPAVAAIEATAAFAGLLLQPRDRRLISAATGESIVLTGREFALLQRFLATPRKTLSRDDLAGAREGEARLATRAVDVQVSRLRHKLRNFFGVDVIHTARSQGYVFGADVTSLGSS